MTQAIFRHGEPTMIDYTPGSGNVNTGDVVLLGNTSGVTCGIAHHDIPNSTQGALAAEGGIYDVVNLNNAADYEKVWWDGTKVTTVSTNNAQFGFVVENGGGGANTVCRAFHHPFV